MPPPLPQCASRRRRCRRAAHPNFIAVLATERTGSFGYVVLEWLEGFPLVDLLRARREITVRETLSLLGQIAPAVDAARDLGLRLALQLRDVLIHFPDRFDEPDEQLILRCPLAEWPVFLVKLDPLGGLDEIDELGAARRAHDGRRARCLPPGGHRPTRRHHLRFARRQTRRLRPAGQYLRGRQRRAPPRA